MQYDVVKMWNRCEESLPAEGVLCAVFFPLGVIQSEPQESVGPAALAYYRALEGGWVYADEPTPLRFDPVYWVAMSSLMGTVEAS